MQRERFPFAFPNGRKTARGCYRTVSRCRRVAHSAVQAARRGVRSILQTYPRKRCSSDEGSSEKTMPIALPMSLFQEYALVFLTTVLESPPTKDNVLQSNL